MRFYARVLLAVAAALVATASLAANDTTKEVCLTPFGMDWKSSEDAKTHLLTMAKREASGTLFGEYIRSMTEVNNFQLSKDQISTYSAGLIRVDGSPEYYNGKGFGEVCVKVTAKVSEEDIQVFKPRVVKKKVCIADPRLSLGDIRQTAERQARVQAVRDYEPSLEGVSDDFVATLIHQTSTEGGGFIPETETYCVTAKGTIYPVELLTATKGDNPKSSVKAKKPSNKVVGKTFFQEDSWKAKITIESMQNNVNSGTIDFRSLNCGGNLIFKEQRTDGYLFEEDLKYGNCVKGCQILIDENGDSYSEICRGSKSGGGRLTSR